MATAGTLLSDLDNAPVSDGDLVNSIYADLNLPAASNPVVQQPQGAPMQRPRVPMQNAQQPLPSTMAQSADPAVPTAHMIGREHPTPADFERMMASGPPMPMGPMPHNAMMAHSNQYVTGYPQQGAVMAVPPQSVKDSYGPWKEELKQPLMVAIILFVLTLPAVHVLASHYTPNLLTPGGTFTTMGLVVRALAGGALYWVLLRIVAPLLSL